MVKQYWYYLRDNAGFVLAAALFLCVISVFTRALTSILVAGIEFDLVGYTFYIVYLIYLIATRKLLSSTVVTFFTIFTITISAVIWAKYPFLPYFKYFLPIAIIYIPMYHILRKIDIRTTFELYVEFAYYTAIFGLFQFAAKIFFGVKILSRYSSPAIDSVAGEPSHYSALLLPALIYSVIFFKRYRKKSIVMFVAMLLTFKVTSYFTFAIGIILAFFKIQYLLLLGPLLFIIYSNYIIVNPNYAYKIIPIWEYLVNGKVTSYNIIHGTPLSFISNIEVAIYSLKINPLLGVGFGGHETSYIDYYKTHEFIGLDYLFGLNSRGGHSLLIRILSELGIIGIISYGWFLIKVQVFNKFYPVHRAIGIACLSHFISKSIKLSSYIDYGTPFFFVVLLVNYQQYKMQLKQKSILKSNNYNYNKLINHQ